VTLTSESGLWNGPLTSDNVASPTFKKVTSFEVLWSLRRGDHSLFCHCQLSVNHHSKIFLILVLQFYFSQSISGVQVKVIMCILFHKIGIVSKISLSPVFWTSILSKIKIEVLLVHRDCISSSANSNTCHLYTVQLNTRFFSKVVHRDFNVIQNFQRYIVFKTSCAESGFAVAMRRFLSVPVISVSLKWFSQTTLVLLTRQISSSKIRIHGNLKTLT
jgi:hypothetical protein